MQPKEVAAAQVKAEKTSARSEHGSVRVGKGSENRRRTEVKLVDSVVNVTNIDSSNKGCGKVVASPQADFMSKKDAKKSSDCCVLYMVVCIIAGLVSFLAMCKCRKTVEGKK